MNNIEIEDFYHHDFTTATEWEVFIARLEEIMHEWNLPNAKIGRPLQPGDFVNYEWDENSEILHFADAEFTLYHLKLCIEDDTDNSNEDCEEEQVQCQKDALDTTNDFAWLKEDYLEIARYYGTREFLVLVPSRRILVDETRIKILLSSLTIAARNSNCDLPALVQVQEPRQKMYLGISVGKSTCSHLDMVHLKTVPAHCKYLTGLLALFKQKIGEGCGVRLDPVMISVRFSYVIEGWPLNNEWSDEPHDSYFMPGETLDFAKLGKLPFGANLDSAQMLSLFVKWPEMSENVVVDSEGFTDLDPRLAPEWSLQLGEVSPSMCFLSEYLSDFLKLCDKQSRIVDLLGETSTYGQQDDQLFSSAFSALTEPRIPTISTVVGRATSRKPSYVQEPISEDIISQILYFLFPDADNKFEAPYGDLSTYNADEDLWKGVKTCPRDSLVWRLAIVAAHCTYIFEGTRALAQLWYEFVLEIRFRWEQGITIPGVGPGFPDTVRSCLLHQKLQMINCCIEKKKAREESAYKPQSMEIDDFETESGEEEFFECTSEELTNEEDATTTRPQMKAKHLLWNKPTGRLAKHPSLKLIQTGDPLYLPITQDPVPKTEDQLEEDAEVMMQLGTDKYGSEMRARLMSASLLSDMESFKAANPGSVLEDFIRWYSPRDWIEDEGTDEWGQSTGHLSTRMQIPDNPWSTTWNSAQPVPAHRQKRLFDDTREAEKALHYLGSERIGQIAKFLLPTLAHAALYTLSLQKQEALPSLPNVARKIHKKLQQATKSIHQKLEIYQEVARDIENVEGLVGEVNALQTVLGGGENNSKEFTSFLIQLMRGKEVPVPGGARGDVGSRITSIFQREGSWGTSGSSYQEEDTEDENKSRPFPAPMSKEFILRTVSPRPSPTSSPQPHRLYANLKSDSILLAGFFSEDTIFL